MIQCLNYEMEEKHDLMEHIAHQVIVMQYLLELAKQLDVRSFFDLIEFYSILLDRSFVFMREKKIFES